MFLMAKKSNSASTASYTVKHGSSLIPLSSLVISFAYNESRKGVNSILGLLGSTKTQVVGKDSQELLRSILARGAEFTEIMVTTPLGTSGAPSSDVKRHQTEEARRTAEMDSLPLFPKGATKGSFIYKDVEVEVTQEDIAAEWQRTFPLNTGKGKAAKPRARDRSEVVISGNRRGVMFVIANAIIRKAGFTDDLITEVRRECRVYRTVRDRKDDSVFLNERGKQGKLESTKSQKLAASFDLIESGGTQSDLNRIFAGNRGVVQLNYELAACLRIVSWAPTVLLNGEEVSGKDAYAAHKEYLLSPGSIIPNQGRLSRMRQYRMMAEHDNGLSDEFASKGPGSRKAFGLWAEHHLGRNNLAAFKRHVKANPQLAQMLSDYFVNIRDKDWVDPVNGKTPSVSSMASTSIQAVAAKCDDEPLVETMLNVAAGADNSAELADVASALMARIEELKTHLCYLRDSKGELTGEPIRQKQLDAIVDKAKPKSRRRSG